MEKLEIEKYKEIVIRRIWWIIIPFLVTLLVGLTHAMVAPKMYQAETLILVVPQKVPETYVRPIVQLGMEQRLRTIKEQVISRTNLERIISRFKLYRDAPKGKVIVEEKVNILRNRIQVTVARGTAFRISFLDKDPRTARDVTNDLASNFISENLRIREEQAIGTSDFLANELETVRKRLEEKEELLKSYQGKHMGAMPENLSTNLSILGRLQSQLEQLNFNLRAAEERKLIIQQQIANAQMMEKETGQKGTDDSLVETDMPWTTHHADSEQLISLTEKLALLERRYTDNHPDVKRLKGIIAKIEAEGSKSKLEADSTDIEDEPMSSMTDLLKPQLDNINLEIENSKAEIQKLKSQVQLYERRVEGTPKREQELLSLTRDYNNLKELYGSLLKRKLEAQIAVSMERKQKGEQFKIIDPAKIPERPIQPNRPKIFLLTVLVGLCLGGGLSYVVELTDTSYKTPEEVEKDLELPVLVSMPIRHSERELRSIKTKKILAFASVAVVFILSAFGIVFATKGIDKTMEFLKGILEGM
jgi:polysaccharide chain length determinant protein (PEP-CTERM system associated)